MSDIKKKDLLFITIILLFCIIIFTVNRLKTQSGDIVSIYIGSQLYRELPLSRDCTIEINNTNTLVIENGYAYMLKADCPDKLCIKQGKISDSSHDIVCLPNKITVRISKHSDIDIISK